MGTDKNVAVLWRKWALKNIGGDSHSVREEKVAVLHASPLVTFQKRGKITTCWIRQSQRAVVSLGVSFCCTVQHYWTLSLLLTIIQPFHGQVEKIKIGLDSSKMMDALMVVTAQIQIAFPVNRNISVLRLFYLSLFTLTNTGLAILSSWTLP